MAPDVSTTHTDTKLAILGLETTTYPIILVIDDGDYQSINTLQCLTIDTRRYPFKPEKEFIENVQRKIGRKKDINMGQVANIKDLKGVELVAAAKRLDLIIKDLKSFVREFIGWKDYNAIFNGINALKQDLDTEAGRVLLTEAIEKEHLHGNSTNPCS